ncbi:glucosamine--fructose-6-phosphate aminotransferase [Methylomusa anaerophila]|uniref:Glucosamine--fructose-6-phosphate aminotransferase n=1 Tax=Methylomusa anaerophila TaxID=1930071 RepID=A0A348AK43_9FIRM|nr:glucosamine--fructose-6-phosphate aminotransferase [Methylomusa anaerophila]
MRIDRVEGPFFASFLCLLVLRVTLRLTNMWIILFSFWLPIVSDADSGGYSVTIAGVLCGSDQGCDVDKPRNLAKSVTVE